MHNECEIKKEIKRLKSLQDNEFKDDLEVIRILEIQIGTLKWVLGE